jgi:DNA-binding transcriptional ArsR family regulator
MAFEVLAEPRRRQILDLLREQPRSVGELVAHTGLSQPGTSKHLRVLREAGLVRVEKEAQKRVYALNPQALIDLIRWVEPYRAAMASQLDALERHLDETAKKGNKS